MDLLCVHLTMLICGRMESWTVHNSRNYCTVYFDINLLGPCSSKESWFVVSRGAGAVELAAYCGWLALACSRLACKERRTRESICHSDK